ncbi:HMCN [Mytilus coruscus]|uniref:HMCN n=1 Tax=Mytilus coruscus TaxID=42192 RepID=A0A6J8ALK4_MYTCO|nr:HMCN [Mytilus coruscus]
MFHAIEFPCSYTKILCKLKLELISEVFNQGTEIALRHILVSQELNITMKHLERNKEVINIILAAPVFKESIIQYEFEVGGNIQLPCSYVAYPAVTLVKWSTDSECGLKDDMIRPILNPDLMIYNATTCNSGNYQCCVKNSIILTISPVCGNNILVGYRPIVIVITEPIVAEYQTRHTIECSVEAFPNISSVEWNITTEAGTKIFSSDENNLGKYFGFSVTSPSLDILMADFTDTGRYICTAENIFGKSSSTIVDIQVYGISLTVSSTYYTVVYGNDVELKCNITGRPDITKVTWSMQKGTGEHQINMANILKYNGSTLSEPSLTIYNLIFEDDGIYFCGA